MMRVTVTHSDGRTNVYDDIVGIDLIGKDQCERVAGRQLSDEEVKYISNAISNCEYFPNETDLAQIIEEMNREVNNG